MRSQFPFARSKFLKPIIYIVLLDPFPLDLCRPLLVDPGSKCSHRTWCSDTRQSVALLDRLMTCIIVVHVLFIPIDILSLFYSALFNSHSVNEALPFP